MSTEKILDTTESSKSSNLLLLNNLDYGINVFCLVVAATLGLISIFASFTLMYLAIWTFFLGIYQLVSAVVGSLRGNKQKRNYLILAVVYLILLWFGALSGGRLLSDNMEPVVAVVFIFVIPLLGAVYYTYLCYKTKCNI